jgi:hypothetical protein
MKALAFGLALLALAPGAAVAQLSSSGDAPLDSNSVYVPEPHPDGYVRVLLPPRLAHHAVVRVKHGTEVYRVENSRVIWRDARGRHSAIVLAVVGAARSSSGFLVETTWGTQRFAPSAQLAPLNGQYTLVFYAPGQQRSPYLRHVNPDYVVP